MEQRGGYFSFMSVAGLRSHLDACVPEAHITVPDGVEKYEEKFFCSTCRGLLETYAQCGFVLADLRNQETPTIYPVEDGTEFEVRCYTVVVSKTDEGELDIAEDGAAYCIRESKIIILSATQSIQFECLCTYIAEEAYDYSALVEAVGK